MAVSTASKVFRTFDSQLSLSEPAFQVSIHRSLRLDFASEVLDVLSMASENELQIPCHLTSAFRGFPIPSHGRTENRDFPFAAPDGRQEYTRGT